MTRPLYEELAGSYDALFADPVDPWVEVVRAAAPPPRSLLDAGCGTGRHAEALAATGYAVTLVDGARALLDQARSRLPDVPAHLADLRTLSLGVAFDAITCRGVLNDVLADPDRQAVVDRFAAHLAPGGVLVLEVRELEATRERYAGGRTLRRDGFESVGRMDGDRLRVRETLGDVSSVAEIRPWSREEVLSRLGVAGLAVVGLDRSPGRPDRLLAIATARA